MSPVSFARADRKPVLCSTLTDPVPLNSLTYWVGVVIKSCWELSVAVSIVIGVSIRIPITQAVGGSPEDESRFDTGAVFDTNPAGNMGGYMYRYMCI